MSKKNGPKTPRDSRQAVGTSRLSRRRLLGQVGAAAGAVATFGVAGRVSAANGAASKWDRETDIVCVGSGAAAGTAAVTAVSLGASVIVVEKMPLPGGTTAKSGGIAWIANNQFVAAQGLQDTREDCLRYMARYAYPQVYDAQSKTLGLRERDYRLLEAFYDNGSKMVEWLAHIKALKFSLFKMWGVNVAPPDYGDHMAENKAKNVRALEVSGDFNVTGGFSGGKSLAYQLEQWLLKRNVPFLLEHRAASLIKQGDAVIGVEATNNGKVVRIRARKGVIFGTGGYSHNTELVRLHQPGLYGACAASCATGDFIAIAQEAGAKMGDLSTAWRTPVVLEQALDNRAVPLGVFFAPGDSMIHVNKYGKRIMNEKRDYNDRTRLHFVFDPVQAEHPNLFMLMVFDERTLNRYAGALPLPVDKREAKWLIEGKDTKDLTANITRRLQSLAGKVGTYQLADGFAANLDATIDRFNKFAIAGRDEDFDRGLYEYDRAYHMLFSPVAKNTLYPHNEMPNETMYPISRSGALYAVLLAPGALDTCGGPAINASAQVLSAKDVPIPGLYGAGNCIASPTGPAYMGAGGTIGPAMTFGYIAARHAVGRQA